ncbi:hypothetical protein VTK73DRAFT_715 [Phialemonium thermophilum]|uniref:AAA+ ATPase domain-containing protein n=1 Tax=Phialemonium thermophilum TaxID=223376 RepID=A0ABR3VUG6_9PEZI
MRMIQALVRFHFERKELEQKQGSQGVEMLGQDFIHGKGRGVVILLHGVPGVGKTATAEAVAQEHRKPLFAITCGDLGITAEDVSRNLSNIFRLANLWDCVLLLDEADVFLSRREKQGHDLQRNALVSVFLRILEYYSGILFLTTNRPGTLDEAVKSRVHASLYYPHLNYDQTMKIFRLNLARLEKIEAQRRDAGQPALTVLSREILEFAHDHFYNPRHQSEGGRWNGRQIRNAFQIAAALAHLDGASSSGSGNGNNNSNNKDDAPRLVVGRAHFVDVAETIRNFDRFRASVLGKHDDEIARLKMERNDEFSDGDAGAPPHGGPAGGPPRTPFGGGGNGRGGGGGGAAAAAFGGGPSPPPPPNSYLAPRDTPLASGGYRGTRQGYGQGNSGLGAGSAGGSNPRGNGYYAQYSQYDAAMGAAPPAASTIPPNPYALPATSSGPGLDGGSSGAPGAGAGATTAAAAAAARYLQADGLPEEIAQSVAAEYRDRSSPTPRYAQGYGTDDATARYDLPPFRPRQSYLNTPGPADPHAFQ